MNGENVQPVEQVAAEGALGNQLGKILIGGGDDADVYALRAIAAQALELLLLEHAKQFGLQFQREVSDFIEEKRAAVGEFETADFLAHGAGESAAFVAEKFGFQQGRREWRRN